jgi:hypothetical protein
MEEVIPSDLRESRDLHLLAQLPENSNSADFELK